MKIIVASTPTIPFANIQDCFTHIKFQTSVGHWIHVWPTKKQSMIWEVFYYLWSVALYIEPNVFPFMRPRTIVEGFNVGSQIRKQSCPIAIPCSYLDDGTIF